MKKNQKSLIIVGFIVVVLFFGLFYYLSQRTTQTQAAVVTPVTTQELPQPAQDLVNELEKDGATEIQSFEISSADQQPIYVEVSRKSLSEEDQAFQPFLSLPSSKDQLKGVTVEKKMLLLIYQQNNTLHNKITYLDLPGSSSNNSLDLETAYVAFIATPDNKKKDILGYCLYTNNEETLTKAKENPNKISQFLTDDDALYEYRVQIETAKK